MKGITVTLYEKTHNGVDDFNRPVIVETPAQVANVLVAPVSDEEILDTLNLTGRRAKYQLGIPKDDTHVWANCKVSFFGQMFRVIGEPTEGIDDLIPLSWNMKVKVETIVDESPSQT